MITYTSLKLIHLASLILWLGPGLGAWIMMLLINRHFGEPGRVSHLVYQAFLRLMWLEHIALVTLLLSGALLGWQSAQFDASWLQTKLLVIVLLIIPMEIIDIWFVHLRLPCLFAKRQADSPYNTNEAYLLQLYHQRFTPLALVITPLAVVGIMFLAIAKPWL